MDRNLKVDNELLNDSYQMYINEIRQIPLLTKEEERRLFLNVANGDMASKVRIIEANLLFVVFLAKKYPRRNIEIMDLIQEGNLGLQYAVDHFNLEKGTSFLTYASYCIEKYILKYLFEKERLIKVPKHFLDQIISFRHACNDLYLHLGRIPSLEEVAIYMNKSLFEVRRYYIYDEDVRSLQSVVKVEKDASKNNGHEMEHFLPNYSDYPEDVLLEKEAKRDLDFVLFNSHLSWKELDVIQKRFGLNGKSPRTLTEIANEYQYTHEGIRQIEKRAIEKLRKSKYLDYLQEDIEKKKKLVKEY